MLVTETQAQTMWCPYAEIATSTTPPLAVNRTPEGKAVGQCIGSQCMAWRWGTNPQDGRGYCGAFHSTGPGFK